MMRRIEVELSVVMSNLLFFFKKNVSYDHQLYVYLCAYCLRHSIYCGEIMVRFQHRCERRRQRAGLYVNNDELLWHSDELLLTRTGTSRVQDTVSLFQSSCVQSVVCDISTSALVLITNDRVLRG